MTLPLDWYAFGLALISWCHTLSLWILHDGDSTSLVCILGIWGSIWPLSSYLVWYLSWSIHLSRSLDWWLASSASSYPSQPERGTWDSILDISQGSRARTYRSLRYSGAFGRVIFTDVVSLSSSTGGLGDNSTLVPLSWVWWPIFPLNRPIIIQVHLFEVSYFISFSIRSKIFWFFFSYYFALTANECSCDP